MAIVYIASKFALKDKVQKLYNGLVKHGHVVTIIWWAWEGKGALADLSDDEFYSDKRIQYVKKRDLFGIDNCDIFVLLSDDKEELNFNGANFEMGYATAKGKEVYIIGKLGWSALYSGAAFCTSIEDFLVKIMDD